MEERALPPVLRRVTLGGAPVIHCLGHLRLISTPAQSATFVDRVKRVEDDHSSGQWNARINDPSAETRHQLVLGSADQPGLGHPAGKLVKRPLVHAKYPPATRCR